MDLRAAWESELRRQFGINPGTDWEFLDWLWKSIVHDHASEIQAGDSEVLESMVAAAERPCVAHVRFSRGGNGGGRGSVASNDVGEGDLGGQIRFDPKTKAHVKALSEYLSKIAAVERRVMEFRRRYLGGPTATAVPAGVPHLMESWSVASGSEGEDDVYLYWTGEERPVRFRGSYWSAIGALDRLGDHLSKKYPWFKDQAIGFVLCGGLWQVKTVSGKQSISKDLGPAAHKFDRCTISLEIEAWMPPELVKKAYARFQREVRAREGGLTGAATTTRRSYGRNAEIFRFVLERSEIAVVSENENLGKLILPDSWRGLRKLWDDHLPTGHPWQYGEKGWRNFYRDFMRGQTAATGSKWGLPGYPNQPQTYEEAKANHERWLERLGVQVQNNSSATVTRENAHEQ